MGGKYRHERLEPELAKRFPVLSSTAPYIQPLFTMLEIDPAKGSFTLRGKKSEWMKPSPQEMNFENPAVEPDSIRAEIRERDSAAI